MIQHSLFYLSTIIYRRHDNNDHLLINNNSRISSWESVSHAFDCFYKSLFTSVFPHFPKNLNGLFQPAICFDDNSLLCSIPSVEVIKSTVFSMKPNKSHGPDGMSPCSFKTYWHIVAPKVIQVVQHFFSTGHLLKSLSYPYLHHTDPKNRKSKQSGTHSCPIFLCNMCYKIITKILASYLKSILDRIILPSQNAFFLEEV